MDPSAVNNTIDIALMEVWPPNGSVERQRRNAHAALKAPAMYIADVYNMQMESDHT